MARATREELDRYHDGELSASARARVEEALRASPEDRAYLAGLERLGDLVRTSCEELAAPASFDGFSERVAARIRAAERPGLGERLGVWFAEFLEHRRAVWIPAASLVGAAAAVLLVLPFVTGPKQPAPMPATAAGGVWAAAADAALPPAVPRGSEAVLASGSQVAGWAFTVPNERGELVGVVWVND